MTNLEIAEFLTTRCKTIDEVISFLKNDCKITRLVDFRLSYTTETTISMHKHIIGKFHPAEISNCVRELILSLTPQEKTAVMEVIHGIKERSKPAKASGGKAPAVVNNITNNNSVQASANAQNTIDIKNLSELSTYVSNSSTITNKAEIQKAISALEEAKDGDSAESYIGLLIKLVGLLCKDGILPPFVGKLVDGLGKWV